MRRAYFARTGARLRTNEITALSESFPMVSMPVRQPDNRSPIRIGDAAPPRAGLGTVLTLPK